MLQRLRGSPGQKLLAAFEKAESDAAQLGTAQIYPNAAAAASINGALGPASTAPTWDVQHEPAAAAKDRPSPAALPLHETSDTDRRAIQGGPLPDAAGHHCSIDDERPLNAAAPQAALLPHQHQHAPDPPVEYDMDFAQRVRLLSFEAPSQVTVSSVGPMVIEMGANLSPQVAAQKRAACDVLKGQPRSSRDDPQFMETFFRASRLHFIGTWKCALFPAAAVISRRLFAGYSEPVEEAPPVRRARIEHLMAELANSAPSPVVEQPNIMNALKGSNKKAERVIMHLVKTGRCLLSLLLR